MRAACPEIVMNRRTRKNLEFSQHQREALERKAHHHQQQPSPPRATIVSEPAPFSAKTTAVPVSRAMPHRNPPPSRAPEQRRHAFEPRFNMNDRWGRVALPLQRLSIV
jgi:hypothetical protein